MDNTIEGARDIEVIKLFSKVAPDWVCYMLPTTPQSNYTATRRQPRDWSSKWVAVLR